MALGRKNHISVGSGGDGKAAAIASALIETAKLNDVNPQTWLSDVLGRIPDHKIIRIDELMPWPDAAKAAQQNAAQHDKAPSPAGAEGRAQLNLVCPHQAPAVHRQR